MRKLSLGLGLLAISTGALIGCGGGSSGGGSGPPAKQGTVSSTGATAVVAQTSTMQTAVKSMDGSSLSASVLSVGTSGAQQIVMPGAAGALMASISSALSTPGPMGGSVDCDAAGCTYNMYKSGPATMNGGVKAVVAGDTTKVTADLTITETNVPGLTGDLTWDINGAVDFTATSINGKLQSNGHIAVTSNGTSITEDFFNLIDYRSLVLGSNGKPSSGSIYAKWGITIAGVPQASQAWEGTVTFP